MASLQAWLDGLGQIVNVTSDGVDGSLRLKQCFRRRRYLSYSNAFKSRRIFGQLVLRGCESSKAQRPERSLARTMWLDEVYFMAAILPTARCGRPIFTPPGVGCLGCEGGVGHLQHSGMRVCSFLRSWSSPIRLPKLILREEIQESVKPNMI